MENLIIKWRQDFDYSADAKLDPPVWRDITDLLDSSRDHAVAVLNGKIPVVVKEGATIISNCMKTRNLYRRRGHKALRFEDVLPSSASLGKVGFFGGVA